MPFEALTVLPQGTMSYMECYPMNMIERLVLRSDAIVWPSLL